MISLTLNDRCDVCRAAAKHVASKNGYADLLFCTHHMFKTKHQKKHYDVLLDADWTVTSDDEAIAQDNYSPLLMDAEPELIGE